MKVSEVMNRKVEIIEPEETVLDAIERLVDKRIRSLIVKPEREGDTYGTVTIRDIVFKCLSEDREPRNVKVKEVTSKPLIYVERDMSVEHVLELMKKFNIARVFVKEENKVIGVVALMDIVAMCLVKKKL
ncbi:MAG: cyclic nucleotide-binding/CBS domain-containing protein [Archaeoglobaceae archaeon]